MIAAAALVTGALGDLLPRAGQPLCTVGGTVTRCGEATGVVVSVEGSGPAEVNSFTLRTSEGQLFDFIVERLELEGGGKPGAHLREHRLDGLPVVVEYKIDGGRLIALRYRDVE